MAHSPVSSSVLWPDELVGPWRVTVSWRVQFGVPTPVGLRLTSWREGTEESPLPAGDADVAFPRIEGLLLRKLPMSELLDKTRALVREQLAAGPAFTASPADDRSTEDVLEQAGPLRTPFVLAARRFAVTQDEVDRSATALREQAAALDGRRGTRDLGDDHYRVVAQVYAGAVQAGLPPTKAVQEHFQIEKTSAAKKVARARERGFLPKTTRGRVGNLEETP